MTPALLIRRWSGSDMPWNSWTNPRTLQTTSSSTTTTKTTTQQFYLCKLAKSHLINLTKFFLLFVVCLDRDCAAASPLATDLHATVQWVIYGVRVLCDVMKFAYLKSLNSLASTVLWQCSTWKSATQFMCTVFIERVCETWSILNASACIPNSLVWSGYYAYCETVIVITTQCWHGIASHCTLPLASALLSSQ